MARGQLNAGSIVLGMYGAWFLGLLAVFAGWVTHVVTCIQTENWVFLIAGAIAAPVGAIHGWGLWFGWWG